MSQSTFEKFARAIAFSQGQFKLFFATCNSLQWRERAIAEIKAACPLAIATLTLEPSETQLYQRIQREFAGQYPEALMVLGLETVTNSDELLVQANRDREAYRNHLPFPLVLWVSDSLLSRFSRVASDFESVGTARDFPVPSSVWIEAIAREAETTFASLLNEGATRLLRGTKVECDRVLQQELRWAEPALEGETPEIRSDLAFLLGRESGYTNPETRRYYEESLALREELGASDRRGVIYYCLGDWWRVQTILHHRETETAWRQAEENFARAIGQFRQLGRDDLIAGFINAWGNALEHIEDWDRLEEVAMEAYQLHQTYANPFRQMRACGFLAEVALARSHWGEAESRAREGLALTADLREEESDREYVHQAGYKFALARAQQGQGQVKQGLQTLEEARAETQPRYELELYLKILHALQQGYFQQGDYVKAYQHKRHHRDTEAQFGLSAFVGVGRVQPRQEQQLLAVLTQKKKSAIASEIAASGRMADVEKLVERVGRNDCKVTVIHGSSGVGKSSLVSGGLVPALREVKFGLESVLPIYLRAYQNWESVISYQLSVISEVIGNKKRETESPLNVQTEIPLNEQDARTTEQQRAEILDVLRQCEQNRIRPVLIFDQFEEFFMGYPKKPQRDDFFEFLGECLAILPLKVIFSLRLDAIYNLLDRPGLDCIKGEILSSSVRYPLGNFSREQARGIIQDLTARSQYPLESQLLEQLIVDLAARIHLVRPIELQIVGAQMQRENIQTLAAYEEKGGKEALIERYFTEVIEDCGKPN
ncbi:MAG: hypothetical protein AB4290_24715 [Spirulina sp.]